MFDRVQVRALAGPLKDIQTLVPKPLLRCLGCVLRVVVLLEGEPSPQSEVLSRFVPCIFPSILTCLPILSRSFMDNSFKLMAWFLLWDRCVETGVYLSKSCPINWIYHRWTPMKLLKHLKDNQWRQDAPELNFDSHSKGAEYLRYFKFFFFYS